MTILGLFERPSSARTRTEVRFSLERELQQSCCAWDGLRMGMNFVHGIKITLVLFTEDGIIHVKQEEELCAADQQEGEAEEVPEEPCPGE